MNFFFSCIADRVRDIVSQQLELRKNETRIECRIFYVDEPTSHSCSMTVMMQDHHPLNQLPGAFAFAFSFAFTAGATSLTQLGLLQVFPQTGQSSRHELLPLPAASALVSLTAKDGAAGCKDGAAGTASSMAPKTRTFLELKTCLEKSYWHSNSTLALIRLFALLLNWLNFFALVEKLESPPVGL